MLLLVGGVQHAPLVGLLADETTDPEANNMLPNGILGRSSCLGAKCFRNTAVISMWKID